MIFNYRVSILLSGVLSPSRLDRSFDIKEMEVFYSRENTLIRGYLTDLSNLTFQILEILNGGLELIEFRCTASNKIE